MYRKQIDSPILFRQTTFFVFVAFYICRWWFQFFLYIWLSIFVGDDSSLLFHLKQKHIKQYKEVTCSTNSSFTDALIAKQASSKSPVWMFFGYESDADGEPKNKSVATCLLCKETVPSKDGRFCGLLNW